MDRGQASRPGRGSGAGTGFSNYLGAWRSRKALAAARLYKAGKPDKFWSGPAIHNRDFWVDKPVGKAVTLFLIKIRYA